MREELAEEKEDLTFNSLIFAYLRTFLFHVGYCLSLKVFHACSLVISRVPTKAEFRERGVRIRGEG